MNKNFRNAYLIALAIFLGGCCNNGVKYEKIAPDEMPATTITRLLSEMQNDLAGVKDYATTKSMTLEEIQLTVNAVASSRGSGSIKILILKVGGSASNTYTNEYTVVLEDVDAAQSTSLDKAVGGFAGALRQIMDARPTVADMETTKIVGSLKFVLEEKTDGGVNFEITPVTVDFGGGATESYAHTLKLTFKVTN